MAARTVTAKTPARPLRRSSRRRDPYVSTDLSGASTRTRYEQGTVSLAAATVPAGTAGSLAEEAAVARHCRSNYAEGVLHPGSCSSPWL